MTSSTAARSTGRSPLSPRARAVAALLTALAVALVGTSVWAGATWKAHVDDRDALRQAREAAVAAARQQVLNLDTIAWSTVDRDLKRVLDGATGKFKDQFTRAQGDLKAQIVERKSVSTGVIVSAGVVRADTDSATVLVAAERTVKDRSAAEGGTAHDRWLVDLEKRDGRWLVAELEPVA